jgi:hypothetical protein
MGDCEWVDEEIIALQAIGRIEDGFIREHLDSCISFTVRVADSRVGIEKLKRGLRSLEKTSEYHEEANDHDSNRQAGS